MGETLKAQVKKNPGSDEALQNQLKALKRTRSTRCKALVDPNPPTTASTPLRRNIHPGMRPGPGTGTGDRDP
jgi:hypothetical protein